MSKYTNYKGDHRLGANGGFEMQSKSTMESVGNIKDVKDNLMGNVVSKLGWFKPKKYIRRHGLGNVNKYIIVWLVFMALLVAIFSYARA
jgi:hypothetical protein